MGMRGREGKVECFAHVVREGQTDMSEKKGGKRKNDNTAAGKLLAI
jgi:hypothetical protein